MKKKLAVILLAFSFVIAPLQVFAQEASIKTQFASGNFEYVDTLYADNEVADKAKIQFAYVPKQQQTPTEKIKIGCKAAYLADPVTGKVFFEKNAHKKMYPASTTKILTALLALEKCDVEEKVKVSQTAAALVDEGYSNANLQAGETHSVYTLLQALMIPSANEAAYALAEHISGNIEDFATLCNERAKQLGCETLHFVNPNGLHNKNHYCSAYDLYLIAKECQKYDVFNEIVRSTSFSVPATDVYPHDDRTYENTNELLLSGDYYYSYCTGIKTGHTTPAGECLVASSSHDDLNVISVVLGGSITEEGNERFTDTKKLFEYVYDHFAFKQIAQKNKVLRSIEVKHAVREQKIMDIVIPTDIYTVAPNKVTEENVQTRISLLDDIKAPIKENQVLGTVTYSVDGLVYTTNIVAKNDVQKLPFWLYNTLVTISIILIVYLVLKIRQKKIKAARKRKAAR